MTLGEKLLLLRKARQWSQEELAEQVGVTRQAVSRWEAGSAKPDAGKLVRLCDVFGVTADYLLREEEARTPGGTTPPDTSVSPGQSPVVSGVQLLGWLILLIGVGIFVALVALSVAHPHTYFLNGRKYQNLAGFLLGRDLVWLMVVSGIAMFTGGVAVVWSSLFSLLLKKKRAL